MWFSTPESFNDPFDCNLSEVSPHTQEDANRFLNHVLKGRPDRNRLMARGTTIANAEKIMLDSKKEVLSKTGVLCLSSTFDNILMWSHYTNSHKGLVVELDILEDPDFFLSPVKVNYTDAYEPTNYFQDQHSAVKKIISTKSTCWSYEKEVRIIKNGVTGYVSFNPKAIRRLIFGCKSDSRFISRIIDHCSAPDLKHVNLSKLSISYAKFELDIAQL